MSRYLNGGNMRLRDWIPMPQRVVSRAHLDLSSGGRDNGSTSIASATSTSSANISITDVYQNVCQNELTCFLQS